MQPTPASIASPSRRRSNNHQLALHPFKNQVSKPKPKPEPKPKTEAPKAKPLSRLEQLRQEARQQQGKGDAKDDKEGDR